MSQTCRNCAKSIRGDAGMAFHLSWCKPAAPAPEPEPEPVAPVSRLDVHAAGLLVTCRHAGCSVDSDAAPEFHAAAIMPPTFALVADRPRVDELEARSIAEPAPAAEPVVMAPSIAYLYGARRTSPRGRVIAPKSTAEPMPKLAKLPDTGKGKHTRCVAHVRVARTAPGVMFACFDHEPTDEEIAERRAFMRDVDAAWNAHHDRELARPTPDGLVHAPGENVATGEQWTRRRGVDAGMTQSAGAGGIPTSAFVPMDREKLAVEIGRASGRAAVLRFAWAHATEYGRMVAAEIAAERAEEERRTAAWIEAGPIAFVDEPTDACAIRGAA